MDNTNPEITNDNVTKTYTDPITGKFVKGNPGGGRPPGALSFATKWERMVDKIATQNNLTPEEIDEQLLLVGYKRAKDGDYSFYRDAMDRIHGRPMQRTDVTTDGEKINFGVVILPAKNESTLGTTGKTEDSTS